MLETNREIQSGIDLSVAVAVFASLGAKSCKSCSDLSARKSNRRSRVIDFDGPILEGSMVGRTEHEVRGNPVSRDRL